jgi:drug/metabolite transporter (DMT)-like permease
MSPAEARGSALGARLQMLAAAALFSTGGSVIKATSLGGWQVAAFRSGVAALALLLLSRAARRGWSWRTPLVGVAYAATLVLFVQANKLTTAANAIFLQATAPLYLLLLSPLLLKEAVRARDVVLLLVLGAGLALFFVGSERATGTAPDPGLGNLVAAASGLTWAFTIAGLRWLARGPVGTGAEGAGGGAVPATVAGNLIGFLVCAPFAFPVVDARPIDAVWIVFLGVFQIALAYLLLTASVRRMPAFEAALLLLLEPVLSAFLAWGLHGEVPGTFALLGAALIVAATVVHAVLAARSVPEGGAGGGGP